VTKTQFAAMTLEQKMAFLQQAVLDKQAEQATVAQGGMVLGGVAAVGLILYLIFMD